MPLCATLIALCLVTVGSARAPHLGPIATTVMSLDVVPPWHALRLADRRLPRTPDRR
jgi:hypothetical protein